MDVAHRITWDEIDSLISEHVASSEALGYKQHGYPVRGPDGLAYWVESHQWQIRDDGSREPRRYRLVRLHDHVQAFPFHEPSRVMEFDTEQGARKALVSVMT